MSGAPPDAITRKALAQLAGWTGWLSSHGVNGFLGEVGWPGDVESAAWNGTATAYFDALVAAGVWSTYWAAGEQWATTDHLIAYSRPGAVNAPVSTTKPQSAVLEAHTGTGRGINVTGGEWGASGGTYSNSNPGTYGTDYGYASAGTFTYLAGRGVRLVRLPFKWERIQPTLSAALDVTELGHLRDAVNAAGAAGLSVILDCHNGGSYKTSGSTLKLGDGTLTTAVFSDLWTRLSAEFAANTTVVGYGLMNEANSLTGGAATWETYSAAACTAIRATGDTKLIVVSGYGFVITAWSTNHPTPWIDSANNPIRYEAHHYWDSVSSSGGTYTAGWTAENTAAQAAGY